MSYESDKTLNHEMAPNTDEPEVKSSKEKKERLFTQEEVNDIIKKRIYDRKKEQARTAQDEEELLRREQALAEREEALDQKEKMYQRKEFLRNNNYPEELLDLITVEEGEDFETKVSAISSLLEGTRRNGTGIPFMYPDSYEEDSYFPERGEKHEPKYSYIR